MIKIIRRSLFAAIAAVLFAAVSHAATFIVPPDEKLVDDASAIVHGTVTHAVPRLTETGEIETVYTVAIDEVLKGNVVSTQTTVVEWGGELGRLRMEMSGRPRYDVGGKYLLFLIENRNGDWATLHLTLGRFESVRTEKGDLLVRDVSEVHGWDVHGNAPVEIERSAQTFRKFVRDRVRGRETEANYFIGEVPRRASTSIVTPDFAGYDIDEASAAGAAAWVNDPASDVRYSISSVPAGGNGNQIFDGEERIIEEDPLNVIPGAYNGTGILATAYWASYDDDHWFDGKLFDTIIGSDIVTQNGIRDSGLGQARLRSVMAHELGLTLGFRHSNQKCPPGPCTNAAIMNSSANGTNAVLQQWDIDAVRALYGNGGDASHYAETRRTDSAISFRIAHTSCTPAGIATQPQSKTVTVGVATSLSVSAAGSPPLSYQWFLGDSGVTTQPIPGATSTTLSITPAVLGITKYWVRVSSTCSSGPPANSATAVITATCASPVITTQSANVTIMEGQSTQLHVAAAGSGLDYAWFEGTVGDVSKPRGTNSNKFTVSPATTTKYWVRVTAPCGAEARSSAFVVTVTPAPCTMPAITIQPADKSVTVHQTAQLSIGVSAGATVKWYRGGVGDTATQIGTGATVNTPALTTDSQFWAQVSNTCGSIFSRQVTVTVEQITDVVPMLNGRFFVQVTYTNQFDNGKQGKLLGRSLSSTSISDTAIFTFGDPLVVELRVRLSDARPFENKVHLFLGGLSDVEFSVVVTDSLTGIIKEYRKPPNQLIGTIDRASFPGGTSLQDGVDALKNSSASLRVTPNAEVSTIQLLNNRFEVRMRYRNQFTNPAGLGYMNTRSIASSSTTETAVFFFDENVGSVEWMVRFSDARPFANRIDFFHGGLSDVEFTIEVLDTVTGVRREYQKGPFSLAGQVDRDSFTP